MPKIELPVDVRIVCPNCGWSFGMTFAGLRILREENKGELPIHQRCGTRMEATCDSTS